MRRCVTQALWKLCAHASVHTTWKCSSRRLGESGPAARLHRRRRPLGPGRRSGSPQARRTAAMRLESRPWAGRAAELWRRQDGALSLLCASPHSGSQRQMAHTWAHAASARVATWPGSESSCSRVRRAWVKS